MLATYSEEESLKTGEDCQTIPVNNCRNVAKPNCRQIADEQCRKVPNRECGRVPVKKCRQVSVSVRNLDYQKQNNVNKLAILVTYFWVSGQLMSKDTICHCNLTSSHKIRLTANKRPM